MRVKKALSIIICVACMLSFTACWDHVEMNKLLIVAGIGLDADSSGKLYHATLEFINIEGDNAESKIIEGEGDSVYSAIQNAMILAGGAMFANHCKVIVFGESLARQGIDDVVNLVLRSPGFRKTLDVLVAKDTTARSIMSGKAVKSDITSFELSKLLRSNADTMNNTKAVSVYELHEKLLSDCPSSVIPAVFLKDNNGKETACVEGAAVFYQSRLKGFLDAEQSKLYDLIEENADNGYISYRDSALSQKPISARVRKSSARATPFIEGERLSLRLDLQTEVILEGSSTLDIDLLDERSIDRIQKDFGSHLSEEAEGLIEKMQLDYETDVFDFYKEFEDCYRHEWQQLKADWPAHFRDMEVEVNAKVIIEGSGLIGNYFPEDSGGNHENALP